LSTCGVVIWCLFRWFSRIQGQYRHRNKQKYRILIREMYIICRIYYLLQISARVRLPLLEVFVGFHIVIVLQSPRFSLWLLFKRFPCQRVLCSPPRVYCSVKVRRCDALLPSPPLSKES